MYSDLSKGCHHLFQPNASFICQILAGNKSTSNYFFSLTSNISALHQPTRASCFSLHQLVFTIHMAGRNRQETNIGHTLHTFILEGLHVGSPCRTQTHRHCTAGPTSTSTIVTHALGTPPSSHNGNSNVVFGLSTCQLKVYCLEMESYHN